MRKDINYFIEKAKEGGFISYALNEFKVCGWLKEDNTFIDEMQEKICLNILETIELITNQGHSEFSFSYFISCLTRLTNFKPLIPLSGDDNEWIYIKDGLYQNKRCYSVFKEVDKDGNVIRAYNVAGKIFEEPDGVRYRSNDSFVDIDFPYNVPDKPEYVKVDKEGNVL